MSSIIKVDTVQDQDGNNIINENANTITIGASGDTITIPSGATLANNGTATGFASIAWQSSIVTAATLTAEAGKGYWINTTSNACTITLPASASVGDQIIFSDYLRTWGTNAVTINQNSLNFQGSSSVNPVYDTNGQSVDLVYSGATQGWIPTVDDDVTFETDPSYPVDFLVIAGGGAGAASGNGGGGGAGGFRTSTQSINVGTAYTVTVGDGGASVTGNTIGNNGTNSSISGSGLTTITSAGGGGGGRSASSGNSGGSGGGGGYETGHSGGAGNTPSTTPSQGNNGGTGAGDSAASAYGGGGGGGAGAVGQNGTTSKGGDGGAGTASSITGSSVTRAGGGGGATNSTIGSGGVGGGGDSGTHLPSTNGGAGTINTGSGGGASQGDVNSGAGGKGVVILSMPLSRFSGTTTGSPTEATSGSNKILTFTATGSYTG